MNRPELFLQKIRQQLIVRFQLQNLDDGEFEGFSDIAMKILQILATAENEGISASSILQRIHQINPSTPDMDTINIFDVEEVLENWFEFLQMHQVNHEIRYSLYHPNFRNWLRKKVDL